MKHLCMVVASVFTMLCLGDDMPSYVMLTNKLCNSISSNGWRYETNGIALIRKIVLPIKIEKQFSDEIITSLRNCCPKEWNDALLSSGNSDDQKMLSLRRHFNGAVLQTPTIVMFQSFANKVIGQDVSIRIHHEKLSYTSMDIDKKAEKNDRILRCFLSVEVRAWR